MKYSFCLALIALAFLITCRKESEGISSEELLLYSIFYTPYEEISVGPGTIQINTAATAGSSYQTGRSYTPKCPDKNGSGELPFTFYRRKTAEKNSKLLINFMGGGSCWSSYNCFGSNTTTYVNYKDYPFFIVSKFFFSEGIFNKDIASNPLKDYDVIIIPHCSADLFFGSKTAAYQDPTKGNTNVDFPHYGHDNFLAVLKYIQENYQGVTDVFVLGQSAGGYSAILNYPHIREAITELSPSASVNVLTDSSVGVTSASLFSAMVGNWDANKNLPTWVTGINSTYFSGSPSFDDYIKKIAAYYSSDRVGMLTSAFDTTQRYFYKLVDTVAGISDPSEYTNAIIQDPYDSNRKNSALFGSFPLGDTVPDGSVGVSGSNCDWVSQTIQKAKSIATASPNFSYYIAPGDIHTRTGHNEMFQLKSANQPFVSWVNSMVNGPLPSSVRCYDGGSSCILDNLTPTFINLALKKPTSNESYASSKDLSQTCNTASFFN
ncbi:pectinacetylesterase [Leptospira koniambonensis]|uniref:Pectinacetylesterase n=1 Tax=Leptospira koniambonensis TaxID=2484950 RepID=A0A4R9JD91_9LEPT|nr:pectin acetylesterase-family hydrolase [Leptospira koniambonensis]TGL36822.1 pectinacetylesterase [Leptospira koniambonensis]